MKRCDRRGMCGGIARGRGIKNSGFGLFEPGLRRRQAALCPVEKGGRGPDDRFDHRIRAPEDFLIDCLERGVQESLPVDVYRRPLQPIAGAEPVALVVQAFNASGAQMGLRVRIEQGQTGRTLWSGVRIMLCNGAPPVDHHDILPLTFEATEALADTLLLDRVRNRMPLDAALMARNAICKTLIRSEGEIAQAEDHSRKPINTSCARMTSHPGFRSDISSAPALPRRALRVAR